MKVLNVISLVMLIAGGLNWLLVGLFKWDLFGGISGGMDSAFARILYVIIGLAAVFAFTYLGRFTDSDNESEHPENR
jgi:uncharacterized membrane protein YuzA (DUF378 family)